MYVAIRRWSPHETYVALFEIVGQHMVAHESSTCRRAQVIVFDDAFVEKKRHHVGCEVRRIESLNGIQYVDWAHLVSPPTKSSSATSNRNITYYKRSS